jgi:hypothetical protein
LGRQEGMWRSEIGHSVALRLKPGNPLEIKEFGAGRSFCGPQVTSSEAERRLFQKEFGIPDSDYLLKPVSQASVLGSSCGHDLFRSTDLGIPW